MGQGFRKWLATYVLKSVLRLYPQAERAWGEALLAELSVVKDKNMALSWAAGGIMVAIREFFVNLFPRLTAGLSLFGPEERQAPYLPWARTFSCLAISAVLLFLPEMHKALTTVSRSWQAAFTSADDSGRWERFGKQAEARGDAAAMAFAALRLRNDGTKHLDEAISLAQHAVAEEPRLTWIYYFLTKSPHMNESAGSSYLELLQKLQRWDPNNAVPYLATAEYLDFPYQSDFRIATSTEHGSTTPGMTSQDIVRYARERGFQWAEWMNRAFTASAYDDYTARRLDLDRQVMRQHGINDPIGSLVSYSHLRTPNLFEIRAYAELKFAEAEEAERRGRGQQASDQYWQVAAFAQQMRLGTQREPVEGYVPDMIAAKLQEDSFEHLQHTLGDLNRPQEAKVMAAAAEGSGRELHEFEPESRRTTTFIGLDAIWVNVWTAVIICSGLVSLVALANVCITRCLSARSQYGLIYAPLLLLISCIFLLISYSPFAEEFDRFLSNPSGGSYGGLRSFYCLLSVPMSILSYLSSADAGVLLWWTVIVTCGIALAWFSVRVTSRCLRGMSHKSQFGAQ